MTSKTHEVAEGGSRELPVDFFDLEVITNRPDPRMGDREILDEEDD